MQPEAPLPLLIELVSFSFSLVLCSALDAQNRLMLVLVFYSFMLTANGCQALKASHLTSLSVIIVCSHTKIMIISLHAKFFQFSADRSAGLKSGCCISRQIEICRYGLQYPRQIVTDYPANHVKTIKQSALHPVSHDDWLLRLKVLCHRVQQAIALTYLHRVERTVRYVSLQMVPCQS